MRASLARRVGAWARSRQGTDTVPVTLRARRVYVLPTRTGLIAAVLLFLMLLAGLNYNNSLALLLCFLLSGVALVSTYQCQRTLLGLTLQSLQAEPTFAGRRGELTLHFDNRDSRERLRLAVRCGQERPSTFHLGAGEQRAIRVAYQGRRRGRQPLERLELSTDAPLGLFRAWCWLHLPQEVIVYPAPLGERPLPPPQGPRADGRQRAAHSGDEDWAWLRPFREGDAPRSVAWKAYAHGGPLLVAHYESPVGAQRVLDFAHLPELGIEQRLSQLTQWVLECEQSHLSYVLGLPGHRVAPRQGRSQRRACLEALALHGL